MSLKISSLTNSIIIKSLLLLIVSMLVIVMIDRRADDVCLFRRCKLQLYQDLTGKISSFVGMVLI